MSASPEYKYSASPKVWENKDDFSQECRCGEGRVIGSRQREKLGYAQERLRRYWEGVRRLSRALSVASQLIFSNRRKRRIYPAGFLLSAAKDYFVT
jgi:hypothetical protein